MKIHKCDLCGKFFNTFDEQEHFGLHYHNVGYIAANNDYGFNYISVIPETVGEYIGRTDKNGKKIFEGDIIKGKVHEGNGYRVRIGVIEYHDVGFIMNLDPNSWYDQKNIPFDCEIKGNIYDNPELLKGGIENG